MFGLDGRCMIDEAISCTIESVQEIKEFGIRNSETGGKGSRGSWGSWEEGE